MKKLLLPFLLLALLCPAAPGLRAQSRPRRVSVTPGSNQPQPNATPASPAATRPPSAPVLGGAQPGSDTTGPRTRTTAAPATEEVGDDEVVRVNTTLVTLPVSVLDRDGQYVPSIRQDEFRIFEDGVEQRVAYFAAVEKPFTVALVLDNSTSTRFRLEEIQDAATAFIDQLRPDDRVLVVAFTDRVRVLAEATSDRRVLRDAIRRTRNDGNTSLYDAVDFVINQRFNRIEGRKAIVLFTDGVDTSSQRASYEANVQDAEELDALIYPIEYDTYDDTQVSSGGGGGRWPGGGSNGGGGRNGGGGGGGVLGTILGSIILGGPTGGSWPGGGGGGGRRGGGGGGSTCLGCSRAEYERADAYLHDMARVSGGHVYRAETTRNLTESFAMIAEQLRRQYSLGYYPKTPARPGERRHVKVRVMRPNLIVQTRDSYIFNPAGQPTTQQADTDAQRTRPVLQGRPFNDHQ